MKDLRDDILSLWRGAGQLPTTNGARAIQFIGEHPGEGATSVAASFAMLAAARTARTAWLVDLDLRRNAAFEGLSGKAFRKFGPFGKGYDASLRTVPFFSVTPGPKDPAASGPMLAAHRLGTTRLLVTRFRGEKLTPDHRLRLNGRPEWWTALRAATDWIVVDSPPVSETRAGLMVCRHMDAVVIVTSAKTGRAEGVRMLRQDIEAAGGQVLGVVLNEMSADARLIDRMLG